MRRFGLIGFPLSHSFSEKYFSEKFEREEIENCHYELFPLENIEDVRLLFEVNKDLAGLNVTIPYKESVIEYLDNLDPVAQKIGAVNCIHIDEIQRTGYNTDWMGFRDAIKPFLHRPHQHALVLGTGGSSKAIVYALRELGLQVTLVSRTKSNKHITYTDLTPEVMKQHTVIVNCTPTGMYPHVDACPDIPYQLLTSAHLLFDLIYNPAETLFLKKGKEMGTTTSNGLEMLRLQAEYAWEIWNAQSDEAAAEE